MLDLCEALVSTYLGSVPSALLLRLETAANSGRLVNGLAKICTAREYVGASIYALTSEWEDKFLKTSVAYSTMESYEYVCHMDHAGRIADSLCDKKQKASTALLRDTIQNEILLYGSLHLPPESWDRSADTSWHKSYR